MKDAKHHGIPVVFVFFLTPVDLENPYVLVSTGVRRLSTQRPRADQGRDALLLIVSRVGPIVPWRAAWAFWRGLER
jgi:hypothetical protein